MIQTEDGTPAAHLHKILITAPDKAEVGLVVESQTHQSVFSEKENETNCCLRFHGEVSRQLLSAWHMVEI